MLILTNENETIFTQGERTQPAPFQGGERRRPSPLGEERRRTPSLKRGEEQGGSPVDPITTAGVQLVREPATTTTQRELIAYKLLL